jgi:hypothetical protein
MPAPPKLTGDRERRLLTLLTIGEPLEAACRAINVSSTSVRKRARRDPEFAERVAAARERRAPTLVQPDWREIAAQLEAEHPERWALPDDGGDPFDGFDFDATTQ